MSDAKADLKLLLAAPIGLVYSEKAATDALLLYQESGREMRMYIVGCLILTLTASVLPQYSLLSERQATLSFGLEQSSGLAQAGFVRHDQPRLSSCGAALVCFHCCARIPPEDSSSTAADATPLQRHLWASPNCYYAKFVDLLQSWKNGESLTSVSERLSIPEDARRYERALRKLRTDLIGADGNSLSLSLAAAFGYPVRSLAVWATRQFMRTNGECPNRAGDLLAVAHQSEGQFNECLLEALDVPRLLQLIQFDRLLQASST